jgi:hypothetical protein
MRRLPAFFLTLAFFGSKDQVELSRRRVETADRAALALYRYAPVGGGAPRRPVLLVPDVGLGREAYDLEGSGLAPYLASHGRDTFVIELRGQGRAFVDSPWRLEDWVARDLPAAVAAVMDVHAGPVDLVVHGYSGALVLSAIPVELKGRIGKVVAISPAVWPEVPNDRVRALLEGGGSFAHLALDASAFDRVFADEGRFPPGRLQALRGSFTDLSPKAAHQLLAWMEREDLELPDGTTLKKRLRHYDRPTLLFLPLLDNFAHPEFASPLKDLAPESKVTVRLLSLAERLGEDYTHLSSLQGSSAPQDVWAPALHFLDGDG